MFGCPCAFVNGNMFAGVYRQSVVVRLTEPARERLLAEGQAQPFSVGGRTMREYVMLADALARTHADTIALIGEAFAFANALPAKKKSSHVRSPSKRKR
jgi:TfoX/Sxy family transcriptional regulator of competence genes